MLSSQLQFAHKSKVRLVEQRSHVVTRSSLVHVTGGVPCMPVKEEVADEIRIRRAAVGEGVRPKHASSRAQPRRPIRRLSGKMGAKGKCLLSCS